MKLFLIFLLFVSQVFSVEEYSIVPSHLGKNDRNYYLKKEKAPDLKAYKNQILDGNGKVLRSYKGQNTALSVTTRYQNLTLSYYRTYYIRTYADGKGRVSTYTVNTGNYMTDNFGNDYSGKYRVSRAKGDVFEQQIGKDGTFYQIAEEGIYHNRSFFPSFKKLEDGKFGFDLNGNFAGIGRDEDGNVYIWDTKQWIKTSFVLNKYGDKENILGVYPDKQNNKIYYVVYQYIDSYNKGIIFGQYDLETKKDTYGWIINSEERNVGFSPSIFLTKNWIVVNGEDSSNEKYVHFLLPRDGSYEASLLKEPPHLKGRNKKKDLDFLVGLGTSTLYWTPYTDDDISYDISKSLYTKQYMQGRYKDYKIAISYLKNEAESQGGLTKKASDFLDLLVDVNDVFAPETTLQIYRESGNINGVAKGKGGAINKEFSSKIMRIGFKNIKERGKYWGVDYSTYKIPTISHFTNDYTSYSAYDPSTTFKKISALWGRDTIAHIQRYENSFSKPFFDWMVGIGYSSIDFSQETKKQIEADSNEDFPSRANALVLDFAFKAGYVKQKKIKKYKGAGLSLDVGYKLQGIHYYSSRAEKQEGEEKRKSLLFEISRTDLWHGPYFNINISY
ncbi:MAG: hypothetical protein OIF32_06685 [Campylobacterales bacterium]|nr:hypothetical protein [Campylobacterales bacterium]